MLTYRLQDREFLLDDGESLAFPNQAVIELKLGPSQVFGMSKQPRRFLVQGEQAREDWNRETGRFLIHPVHPYGPIEVQHATMISTPSDWQLNGDILQLRFQCRDIQHLEEAIKDLNYNLITLLNIGFTDPPFVESIRGWVAETEFRWVHQRGKIQIEVFAESGPSQIAIESFDRMKLIAGNANRRLAAALHYFHVACRLLAAGQSQWEFMPECILNLEKSLTILLAKSEKSRDEVREQLKILGYCDEQIDGDFIPIMILRAKFDVAHPRLAVFPIDQLQTVYDYLIRSEECMRKLFRRVLDRVADGTYQLIDDNDHQPDPKSLKEFTRLIDSMRPRLGLDC